MANTITSRTIQDTQNIVVVLVHIVSDGSEESDTVVFDNSAFFNAVSKGKLMQVQFSGSDCICRLEWDQTTDSAIGAFNPVNSPKIKYWDIGGICNPNGTGATGDIVLTTANLDSGDEVTMVLWVKK